MRARVLLCALFVFTCSVLIAQDSSASSPPQPQNTVQNNDSATIEGTVVSSTHHTLVVRDDNGQYHLFTYEHDSTRSQAATPGSRVRVSAGVPDEEGTRVAYNVDVLEAAPATNAGKANSQAQVAAPPPQVKAAAGQVENEARRWHVGGRIGVGFSPEIFLFGVQSQIGPFFSPHFMFRPNVEFGFGEITDMFAFNLEGAYRLSTTFRHGWVPYFGVGPSLNFINQSASSGSVSFGNFTYKTGFNVFVGGQRRGTFVEMKTSLWSGPAPVLRLAIGYNF